MAAAHLKRGDYAKARETALRALRLSPAQGEAVLTLSEAALFAYRREPSSVDLAAVSRQIKTYRNRQWDYAGEVGFYDLYFDHLRREPQMSEKLADYLDRDPQLTIDHRHNVFVYRGRAQWNIIARLCEQMSEQLSSVPRAAVLLGSCYAREARWDPARVAIERGVHQAPKDPLTQAWYSLVLRESGDPDQASVILGRATEFNRRGEFMLPSLLQARFSQKVELTDSARSWWQKMYERDLEYLPALGGLATLFWKAGSRTEALPYVQKGLKISPDYIPLLELKQKAEADGSYTGAN